eukprot:gene5704-biopygen5723
MPAWWVRASTTEVQRQGPQDFLDSLSKFAGNGLLATVQDVMGYTAYAAQIRPFCLDSSTVRTYIAEFTAWHAELRGYVLSRRFGRHQLLQMVVQTFGCLRPGALKHIQIRGSLVCDKNADAWKPKCFYTPGSIPALEVHPVQLLKEYVVREFLLSELIFCSDPWRASGWYPGPHSGLGRACQKPCARAFPDQGDAACHGDGSLRKSLGHWIWTDDWSHPVLSDVGGCVIEDTDSSVGMYVDRLYVYNKHKLAMAMELPYDYASELDHVSLAYSVDWDDSEYDSDD